MTTDSPPARLISIPCTVGRASVGMLVRPDTRDAEIVHEVTRTYGIDALAEAYRWEQSVTIFDIGAHIGTFSVLIATLLPRAVVYAFEAAPENAAVLRANVQHAGLTDRVHPFHAAIGARAGFFATSDIGRSPDAANTGGHSVTGITLYDTPPHDGRSYAEVLALGPLLDRHSRVDILKIDCEGSEFEILYNLSRAQLERVGTLLGEIHGCVGFAGTTTNGHAWNGTALTDFLRQPFDTVATSHRVDTDTAVLETFHATRRQPRGRRAMRMLRHLIGR